MLRAIIYFLRAAPKHSLPGYNTLPSLCHQAYREGRQSETQEPKFHIPHKTTLHGDGPHPIVGMLKKPLSIFRDAVRRERRADHASPQKFSSIQMLL